MIRYKHIKHLAEVLEYPYEKILKIEALDWAKSLIETSRVDVRGVKTISNNSLYATFNYVDKDRYAFTSNYDPFRATYREFTLFRITKDTHIVFNRLGLEDRMFDLYSLLKNDCDFSNEKIEKFMRPIVRSVQKKYQLNKVKSPKYFWCYDNHFTTMRPI